jgi:hypothetical protein
MNLKRIYLALNLDLMGSSFSKKWHITENLEKGNLGKINENKFSAHQTSRIGPKPIK